ncbi:hypothetical protein [Bacillus sp. FJAT-22090]|uniref:hypothetical protein n=1 Tax=Bacillus sp. FJAT-22090 TaxID=1581038 RepID=UPI0011A447D8|nr:hypothetical protein [Bacillus sp. FJAT-22090]
MNIERSDSIRFGEQYCEEHHRSHLAGKTVKLTPQYFEEDNGLYCYEVEEPGICEPNSDEPDSIYHLFGNNFENFMDCSLIKGTEQDKAEYQKIIDDMRNDVGEYWEEFAKSNNL